METIYLNPTNFKKVKPTETFPNPNIIQGKIKGIESRIVKASNIFIEKATQDQIEWHGLKNNSYILRCDSGHFPSDLIMTVENRKFVDGYNIGAVIGRNLGTASLSVTNLNKSIQILEKNNFLIIK